MKMILTATEINNTKAKRTILKKSNNIEELRTFGNQFTRFNTVEIYDSKWNLIETIGA